MKMAHAVQQLAESTPGKEAQAIEAFARALRQVYNLPSIVSRVSFMYCSDPHDLG
jgi:hypothetical protein